MQPIQPNNPLLYSQAQQHPEKKPKGWFKPREKRRRHLWSNFPCAQISGEKNTCEDISSETWTKRRTPSQSPLVSGRGKKNLHSQVQKNKWGKHDENKITISYSSVDLLKQNHMNSPTLRIYHFKGFIERQINEWSLSGGFQEIKFLGGKFGQVHLVVHIKTNTLFALKQIKKDSIVKNKMQDQLLMEIKCSFINHPNIPKTLRSVQWRGEYLPDSGVHGGRHTLLNAQKEETMNADASHKLQRRSWRNRVPT